MATASFRRKLRLDRVRDLYDQAGEFAKAEQLLAEAAGPRVDTAAGFPSADLQELLRFLVRMVLPESVEPEVSAQ